MGDLIATLILATIGIGLICSRLAKKNGQNPRAWFCIGFVFNLVALVILLFVQFRSSQRNFPKLDVR